MRAFVQRKALLAVLAFLVLGAIVLTTVGVPGAAHAATANQGDTARIQSRIFYLAEGYTGGSYDTWVLLQNPGAQDASVRMTFQLPGGATASPYDLVVPAMTRRSVRLDDLPGLANAEVSTTVVSDRPIFVNRSMYFEQSGIEGGTSTEACVAPDFDWFFAEGYTGGAFETYILLQNPGPDLAKATLEFQLPSPATAAPYALEVPPYSRRTVKLDEVPGLGATDAATVVRSSQPIVAERAMYFDYFGRDGGHCAMGLNNPDTEFFVAEGYTGGAFDTYLLVQNPGAEDAAVQLEFQLPGGVPAAAHSVVVPARSRRTVKLDDLPGLGATSVSTLVNSDKPVVVERALYFDSNGRDDGSCAQASDSISDIWQVTEGCTRPGFDTYILVQNMDDVPAQVQVAFQLAPGYAVEPLRLQVGARTRETIHVNALAGFPATDVSATVTADRPVVVESAMYFAYDGIKGGHSSLGTIPNLLMPNGVMLDQASEALVTSAPADRVVFSGSNALIDSIDVGDVICGMPCAGAPAGFLRKVTDVQRVGGTVTVMGQQAALQELVRYGRFYGGATVPAQAGGFDVSFPFDVPLAGYGDIKGNISLGVSLDIDISIRWKWKIIPVGVNFKIAAAVTESASIGLTASRDISVNQEINVYTYNMPPIWAGPLVFFPKVNIFVGFSGNLTAGTTMNASESLSATAGFGCDGSWYTIADFDPAASADASIPYRKMDNKTWIREEIECLLYDVVGPFIDLQEYIRLHADPAENPWWVLYAGVQSDGGVDINVIIFHLRWSGTIFNKEWQIKSAPAKPAITGISPNPSPPGSQVTLSGSNFGSSKGGSWYVSFGGTNATEYQEWSDGRIVCTVPAGISGQVNVQVWNDGGLSAPFQFGVQPHIAGLSPPEGRVGASVTISGAGFGPTGAGSYISFGGVPVTNIVSWSDGSIVCLVPQGAAGAIDVVVVTPGGASNAAPFKVTPQIDGVVPGAAVVGSTLTISGNAFGTSRGSSYVSLGPVVVADIVSWSNTTIVCNVPHGTWGVMPLRVTTSGGTSNAVDFKIVPAISQLSTSAAHVGDKVGITGTGFGWPRGESVVRFGPVYVTDYVSWADDLIECYVPWGAGGMTNITVTTAGGTSAAVPFNVVPLITGLAPDSGTVGSLVTITGSAFVQGNSYVSFGNVRATAYASWTYDRVVCQVPLGASGVEPVTVTTDGGTSNPETFRVIPNITGITPPSAQIDELVTITGTAFGGTQGASSVSFGPAMVTRVEAWSDTSITLRVPDGTWGRVPVTVTTSGGTSNSVTFGIVPTLAGISPGQGTVGTPVTFSGNGFGPEQADSFVSFGSVRATDYVSWNDERVVCKVPAGASGLVLAALTTDGGTSAAPPFGVVPGITEVTPPYTIADEVVVLSGSAFGDVQAGSYVMFGPWGANDIISWADGSIKLHVPKDASGDVTVTVTTAGGVSSGVEFGVVPYISVLDPASGAAGTTLTVNGSGFGAQQGASKVLFGTSEPMAIDSWSNRAIKCKVPQAPTSGAIQVVTAGGLSNLRDFTVLQPDWYLAEGTCAWGFDTYITIENPNTEPVSVTVTYMTPGGHRAFPGVALPATSQTTIHPADMLGFETDFSTRVLCEQGKTIAVDRTMSWNGQGAVSPEGHCSIGTNGPALEWFMPEGVSAYGFESWLLIQNPNDVAATCQVTYMIDGGAPVTLQKTVPAQARQTYNMIDDIGPASAGIQVASDIPVVAERATYRYARREGHESIATTLPAQKYYGAVPSELTYESYLAEGSTQWGFTTWLLLLNPNDEAARVVVTYMLEEGPVPQEALVMPPKSRETILVNDVIPGEDFAIQVHSDKPVGAERAMYWGAGTAQGEASHDTVAVTELHDAYFFPDGQTGTGRETYTLLQNPGTKAVDVEVKYLSPEGKVLARFTVNVPAGTRRTVNMADVVASGRAAIELRCARDSGNIMAERVMYWNGRGAGTCSTAGWEDILP